MYYGFCGWKGWVCCLGNGFSAGGGYFLAGFWTSGGLFLLSCGDYICLGGDFLGDIIRGLLRIFEFLGKGFFYCLDGMLLSSESFLLKSFYSITLRVGYLTSSKALINY